MVVSARLQKVLYILNMLTIWIMKRWQEEEVEVEVEEEDIEEEEKVIMTISMKKSMIHRRKAIWLE